MDAVHMSMIPSPSIDTMSLWLAAEALTLVSWWKPLLVLAPLVGWAWVVSVIYDKDAARYYFKRRQWNLMHLGMGTVAFLAAVLSPAIYIGVPVMMVVLAIDLFVYYSKRNADNRVAESARWALSPAAWFAAAGAAKSKGKKGKIDKSISLTIRGPKGVVEPPAPETPEIVVRLRAEELVVGALDKRGTRVDIGPAPDGKSYASTVVVDGVRQPGATLTAAEAVAVIDFWKAAAGLDVQDRRRKQQADLPIERLNIKHRLRLTTQGAGNGMTLAVAIDPEKQTTRKVDELGLAAGQKESIDKILKDTQGLVLLAAPRGQGLTSLMYAVVRSHDAYTKNVQTLETEVQGSIEGVRQNLFDPLVDGAEYGTTARSLLRRDPDVLALSDMPDAQTAAEVLRAETGRTRVYLSLRVDGVLAAIQTYVKAAGDAEKAGKQLHGAIAGKLLRKLCPNCKQAYTPTADMLKKLGLPGDKTPTLYRKGGQVLVKNKPEPCPMCAGGGYLHQDGCYEVFPMGDEERRLVAAQDWAGLKAAMRKSRCASIQESALRKALEGVTSVEEVVRITASATPAAGAAPSTAGGQAAPAKPAAGAAAKPAPKPAKPG